MKTRKPVLKERGHLTPRFSYEWVLEGYAVFDDDGAPFYEALSPYEVCRMLEQGQAAHKRLEAIGNMLAEAGYTPLGDDYEATLAVVLKRLEAAEQTVEAFKDLMYIENEPDVADLGLYTQLLREDWIKRRAEALAELRAALDREGGRR